MKITRVSPVDNKERTLEISVTPEQYAAWESGVLIQDAMPNATADEREFILTGITAEQWDKLFQE